jgi:hypothetical protein
MIRSILYIKLNLKKKRKNFSSYVGSLAKFRNKQTFSIEPFSSKSCLKKRAVSILTFKNKSSNLLKFKSLTYTHSCKNNGKIIIFISCTLCMFNKTSLTTDLCSNLIDKNIFSHKQIFILHHYVVNQLLKILGSFDHEQYYSLHQ